MDFPADYERARTEILPAIEQIPTGFRARLPFPAPEPEDAAAEDAALLVGTGAGNK